MTTDQLKSIASCIPSSKPELTELVMLRKTLRRSLAAMQKGLLAAKRCQDEMPGTENALDVLEIEMAIANAERALFGSTLLACPNCDRASLSGSLCPACEVERRGEENASAEGLEL